MIKSIFFWDTSYYDPGFGYRIYEKHLVIPWFFGLRLPIFQKSWWVSFFKYGHFDCLDTLSRDHIFYLLPWSKSKEKYKWISIMSEGAFPSLKELREFWQDFENSFHIDSLDSIELF